MSKLQDKVAIVPGTGRGVGAATQIAYSNRRGGVVGLTKTPAKEWRRYNVTVNAVAFGFIETRLTQPYSQSPPTIEGEGWDFRLGSSAVKIQAATKTTPLGHIAQAEDAAGAIYLFCIPESDIVTEQTLTCASAP